MTELEIYKKALEKISKYAIKPTSETKMQRIKRLKAIADKALFIANVVQRTWLFCGGYNQKYFEIEISAEDRETAIAYFETYYPELKWVMTKELQYVALTEDDPIFQEFYYNDGTMFKMFQNELGYEQ